MFTHPVWLVGFRPFFTLAFVSGALLPLLWAAAYSGHLALPASADLGPVQWHAHEMLFGFGGAVLGGFLLTASKNWVNVRGLHGGPLALAALLWLLERGALFLPAHGAVGALRLVLLSAFQLYVFGYVVVTLVRHRKQDSFPDNGFFIVGLPVLVVAHHLLLRPDTWTLGMSLSIGIFRLAFAVMFERTTTQFMKNALGTALPRYPWLDYSIKGLVLLGAFEAVLPAPLAALVLGLAALLLLARFLTWKPLLGLRTFGIGLMYVGYLGLVVRLALAALRLSGLFVGTGTLSTHAFTFLCMGLIIPAMLVRICQGHTGRKIAFTASDRLALGAMGAAAFFRLVATQLWPGHYATWVALAALGWSACFVVLGVRLVPPLWQARIDGRVH